ncbi:MAG: MFS transporter [Anaerolineaceae bacterium]|nr:MFS transporter [Anaerolineaceae bacterium]
MYVPRTRQFWAVAISHFALDVVMSSVPVLLTFISLYVLPMSAVQFGLIVGLMQLTGAVTQPMFGWLTDRIGGRWTGSIGVCWTASLLLFGLLAAESGLMLLMAVIFIITALGSGAFHPVGMKYAAESHPPREASNMAWFFLAGQMGLAFGPALVGLLLENAVPLSNAFGAALGPGLSGLLQGRGSALPAVWVALLSLPGFFLILIHLPGRRAHRAAVAASAATGRGNGVRGRLSLAVLLLFVAMISLRSLGSPGVVSFIPFLFQQKGWTPAEYGLIASLFWVGSGLAGVFFGGLADRYDQRLVIAVSMLLSAPTFFLLPLVDGVPAFTLAVLSGTLSGASHGLVVVLAQGFLPASRAMASGAALGLVFGTGAVGSAFIGWLAGIIGLGPSFQLVAVAIVLASVLTMLLPAQSRPAGPTTEEVLPARSSQSEVNV